MDNVLVALGALLVGVVLGGIGTWFVFRERVSAAISRTKSESETERATLLERLKSAEASIQKNEVAIEAEKSEMTRLRELLAKESSARSAAEEKNSRIGDLEHLVATRERTITELQRKETEMQSRLSETETRLLEERKASAEKLALLDQAQQKLSDAFSALSAKALNHNNESFLHLAKTTLEKFQEGARGDLEKRQQAISEIVKPVRESLQKFENNVQEIEKERKGAYESLTGQVKMLMATQEHLRTETGNLVRALRTPNVRGRWGELQLKRVVEMAGMLEYCDFDQQQSVDTDNGRLRPDLIVQLPGGKRIVVDAKAPLEAYLGAAECVDDTARKAKMEDHARQIRNHMTSLGKKAYWEQFSPAPEFVVLFLPGESFFSAALESDPSLIELGVDQKVILATPTTLIALLRAVAYGWQQEALAENAQVISDLGRELYKRISDMADHWTKVGQNLGRAVEAYNKAVGSLESRVLTSARKFKELQAGSGTVDIEEITPIESSPRALQAPEITGDLFGK